MTITIKADAENNAETFWDEFDSACPTIADEIRQQGHATVSQTAWAAIQKLAGFRDGPEYARTALVVVCYADAGKLDASWYSRCLSNGTPSEIVDWFIAALNILDVEIDDELSVSAGGRWLSQAEIDEACHTIDHCV